MDRRERRPTHDAGAGRADDGAGRDAAGGSRSRPPLSGGLWGLDAPALNQGPSSARRRKSVSRRTFALFPAASRPRSCRHHPTCLRLPLRPSADRARHAQDRRPTAAAPRPRMTHGNVRSSEFRLICNGAVPGTCPRTRPPGPWRPERVTGGRVVRLLRNGLDRAGDRESRSQDSTRKKEGSH